MAANAHPPATMTTPDTLITVKVSLNGSNRKFKLPLKELTPAVFVEKLRTLLQVPPCSQLNLERFSDSSGAYIVLNPSNPATYKQLYRAAKAKLKLRIRANIVPGPDEKPLDAVPEPTSTETTTVEAPPAIVATPTYERSLPASHSILCERPAVASASSRSSASQPCSKFVSIPVTSSRATTAGHPSSPSKEPESGSMKDGSSSSSSSQPGVLWHVFCNHCDATMDNEHFHCSTCDFGDFDLCKNCVDSGVTCNGNGHWLIKRYLCEGKVINSTTERIAPKRRRSSVGEPASTLQSSGKPMPGAFKTEVKSEPEPEPTTRTCNSCVRVLPEPMLVTCVDCDDYDVCIPCHFALNHGHHPGHTFKMIVPSASTNKEFLALCAPGRNVVHAAICDGCNIDIRGVRHKCLDCPDWDYCHKCYENASEVHPGHRFAPIYASIGVGCQTASQHWGIYCDGPLCKGKTHPSYIRGVRYKCTVCHDTDFCANCEAHPNNKHNVTHPLIKFRTQVTNVSVTTIEEDTNGRAMMLGDLAASSPSKSSPTTSAPVARVESSAPPSDAVLTPSILPPVERTIPEATGNKPVTVASSDLDAHFLQDRIIDGTQLPPSTAFLQSWTLKNPGPNPWPVGCCVRHVGGDNMLNLDYSNPSSTKDLALAQGSNATTSIVEVGASFHFMVVMRTPARDGKYISYWRLKAPDGTPFGHKLWCDVEVNHDITAPAPYTAPSMGAVSDIMNRPKHRLALADYQMQLMLLEQQNKKRLMWAREQQARQSDPPYASFQASSGSRCYPFVPIPGLKTAPEAASESSGNESSSTMVFPKLEKESPTSSTSLEPEAKPNAAEEPPKPELTIHEYVPPSVATDDEAGAAHPDADFEEDDESMLDEDEEDDEEFLTDEEYDILDASDEDIVDGAIP